MAAIASGAMPFIPSLPSTARHSRTIVAISRQPESPSATDLFRRQSRRALGITLGFPDQFHDPARKRCIQPAAPGDSGDDALQIINLGAAAALPILPHL